MLSFNQYVRAKSLEEAYALCQKKNNVILGGMLWLRMQNKKVGTAIDLCDLGLDQIEETEDAYKIGAMVTLRQLETHQGLQQLTNGAMAEAFKHIVGVQFRNLATVGGSIYGRFGFSDVLTLFMALHAKVELYQGGIMEIEDFAKLDRKTKDILTQVIIPKTVDGVCYQSMRNTATDFPVLACCVSKTEGGYTCAVGARPALAQKYTDEKALLANGITEETAATFGEDVATRCSFGSNMRGSEEYRRKLCKVLVRRAVLGLQEEP